MTRVACTLLLVVMGGCAHKQETKAEAPKAAEPAPVASAAPVSSEPQQKMCATDLDCGAKQLCLNNKCTDITADLAACTDVRVHFPFNSDQIDPNDKAQLDRSARCLKADHALRITIEGNADERGTQEYNMALGDRRAHAVSSYLQSLGASQAQLATVSFGKENPECQEHDEACWAKNRRAALKGGGAGKPSATKK